MSARRRPDVDVRLPRKVDVHVDDAERERKRDAELLFGGVRTFALIALLGALCAFAQHELNQGGA